MSDGGWLTDAWAEPVPLLQPRFKTQTDTDDKLSSTPILGERGMSRVRRRLRLVAAAAAMPAAAQTWPAKPVRLIVPFAPGGSTDITARIVAQKLSESWRQQGLADNRARAGGQHAPE